MFSGGIEVEHWLKDKCGKRRMLKCVRTFEFHTI